LQGEVLNRVYWFTFNRNPLKDGGEEFLIGSTYPFFGRPDGFLYPIQKVTIVRSAPMTIEKTVWPSKAGR
jgi:hypothetical protein